KALRGIAHMRIDVGLRIGMTETLLDDRDAHSSGAAVERLGVAACRYATLARVETVGAGNHLEQQWVVVHVRSHRPAGIDGDLRQTEAGIRTEPEGRFQADDAAMARRNSDRAGLVAADRHIHLAGGDERRAARRRSPGGVAALARIVHRPRRAGMAAA